MGSSTFPDPAERSASLRLLYRDWRPTRLGRRINRLASWSTTLGLSGKVMAVLEVRGRVSGRRRSIPVVVAALGDEKYLVSMLGARSNWVKNVEAAHGDAVLRQRRRRRVHLVEVPTPERPPILSEYVRVATSGRNHLPVPVGAPLTEFEAIAERYPVFRIDPS
jgi:hypothetical protein